MMNLEELPLRKSFHAYCIGLKIAGGASILGVRHVQDMPAREWREFSEVIKIDSEGAEAAFYLARPELRPVIDWARRWVFNET